MVAGIGLSGCGSAEGPTTSPTGGHTSRIGASFSTTGALTLTFPTLAPTATDVADSTLPCGQGTDPSGSTPGEYWEVTTVRGPATRSSPYSWCKSVELSLKIIEGSEELRDKALREQIGGAGFSGH